MKALIVALLAVTLFSIPSISSAATGRPGPYVTGFLGTSFARDTTISGFDSFTSTAYSDRTSFDPGIYLGGSGGYDFGFMRLEGELAYRHAQLDTVTDSLGNRFRNVDGNLGAFSTMFNVYFDLHNSSRITPYLGGGLGFASLYLSETTAINSSGNKIILYDASNDTVFATQVGAGMDIAINNRSSIDVGYRYFITDKARLNGDFTSSDLRFESHNMLVGFKFKF
jgi:opacity protein-like surface antigen